MFKPMILLCLIPVLGCASQQKVCKECPTLPGAFKSKVENERLTDQLPANALATLVVRRRGLAVVSQWLAANPELKSDLSAYLKRTIGVDLTDLRGVMGFVTSVEPPSAAVLLRLPAPATPKGESAGPGQVLLVRDSKVTVVAAAHPLGMVLGTPDAVKLALDKTRVSALKAGKDATLAPVLAVDGDNVDALIGAGVDLLPPAVKPAAKRFGITSGALTYDASQTIILRIQGDPQRLDAVRGLVMKLAQHQLTKLERRKQRAVKGDKVARGVAAISAYHAYRRLLEEAQPRLVGGELVSRYQLPRADSAQVYVAVVGVLAAIAVPAFIKYIRKSKTVEATESLDKLAAGAKSYYFADHYGRQGRLLPKRFPPGAGWSPSTPCCAPAGGPKCMPGQADWNRSPWKELHFAPGGPHYYQYRFASGGAGKKATFIAEARGDLDCDGTYSNYKIYGAVGADGSVLIKGPVIENEIE